MRSLRRKSPAKTVTLLAVDDNPEVLSALRTTIVQYLPESVILTTVAPLRGLRLAAQRHPDAALIDVQMPGMTGIEMCRRLKTQEPTTGVRVILMADGQTTAEMRAEGLKAGADDVIQKPIDSAELIAGISAVLRMQAAKDITESQQAKELSEYRRQLRQLTRELSLAEERQRGRLAAILHDQFSQNLAAMGMHLQLLREVDLAERPAEALKHALGLLERLNRDIRTLTFELCPPVLHNNSLAEALLWLTGEFQRNHGIVCRLEKDAQAVHLSTEARDLLLQAVRELLVNIVKHAGAHNVKVTLATEGGFTDVRVEDDGVGFDVSMLSCPRRTTDGFGLFSIRRRLEHLGGSLGVESHPGRGTVVSLALPVDLDEPQPTEERLEHTNPTGG